MVDFEDLAQLDGPDLRSVFSQVTDLDILDALAGSTLHLRRMFLTKLSAASAAKLEAETAQAELADRLRRLHDHGQLTLPDPNGQEAILV